MPRPRGALLARHSFELGEVFPASDRMARYVMRLSMALGDLRIVADYVTRERQPEGERLYFVRLFALHLHEIANLIDPPNQQIIPTVDDFLRSLPRGTKPSRTEIRREHAKAMRRLSKPMKGRTPIRVNGELRIPTLRDDLRRLRNDFAHYGHNAVGADAVKAAMAAARDVRTGYVIRERTLRAQYADTVAMTLTHPFDVPLAYDMHGRIVDLLGPISNFIHAVEAAWLSSRPPSVVTTTRYQR